MPPLRGSILFLLFASFLALTCKETDTVYEPVNTLTDASVMPAVIYTFPAKNTVGPYYSFSTALSVRFNKLMDIASVHRAIHFYSPSGELLPDTNLITSTQGDVATITPVRANTASSIYYRVGHTYTLKIDSTAKDVNGNRLPSSFKMTFTPEPYFRVKSISPAAGTVNVNQTSLTLSFNGLVDTTLLAQIRFSPAISGMWSFPSTNLGVTDSTQTQFFTGGLPFPSGQNFTVTIPGTAKDKSGDSLAGGFTSTFSTAALAVTSTSPRNGTTGWGIYDSYISLYLDDALDTSTIRGALKITPAAPGWITLYSNGSVIQFEAAQPYLPETKYTVTLDTSLRSAGHSRLVQPYTFTFTTGTGNNGGQSPFYVYYSYPANGDSGIGLNATPYFNFYGNLDTSTFRAAFSIVPPVAGLLQMSEGTVVFSPIRNLPLGTTYTITLGASIRSLSGDSLGTPYVVTFTTLPFEVTATDPADGTVEVGTNAFIQVFTSDTVDTGTVRAAFSISPAVSGSLNSYYYGYGTYFTWGADSALQPYTAYTVNISRALKSKSGTPIAHAYKFSFATGGN